MDPDATVRPLRRLAPSASDNSRPRPHWQNVFEITQDAEEEDVWDMSMSSEEMKALQDAFSAVHAEFSDLDGLSWETPQARQALLDWHAQKAVRQRPSRASPGDLRARRTRPRRSLSSLLSPLQPAQGVRPAFLRGSEPVLLSKNPDVIDAFNDETVRAHPSAPLVSALPSNGRCEDKQSRLHSAYSPIPVPMLSASPGGPRTDPSA